MKYIPTLILLFMISGSSYAQSILVNVSRTETDDGTKSSVLVYFVDTTNKTINDSLDLYDLNPYNYLPYESYSTKWEKNKTFEIISYNEFDKIFPANYRNNYFDKDSVKPGRYTGLLSSTIALSSIEKPAKYLAIAFSLFAKPNNSDQIDGAISTIFVFDNKKNIIYKNENAPCVNNEIAISDDGRYLAFCYGASWSDGQLIKDGIQIVNTKTGAIVFEDNKGYVEGPSGGNYPDLIQFTCNLGNFYVRDYYFNTKSSKLYSLRYNRLENENTLIDIKPGGLLFKDRSGKELFMFFEKNFDIQTIK